MVEVGEIVKKSVSRVVLSAAVVAVLGMATGCGGSSDESSGKPSKGGKSGKEAGAPTGQVHAPLTAAELEKAAVTAADAKGYEIRPIGDKELSKEGAPKAGKPECQALAALFGAEFTPKPTASVFRTFSNYAESEATAAAGPAVGMVRISSYSEADAKKTVADLKAAVGACKGGFTASGTGDPVKVTEVNEAPAPQLGDEALAFSAKGIDVKEPGLAQFEVVRSGGHLSVFMGLNELNEKHPQVPEDLVKTQVAKLERALGVS
ncbi:hypothetical protein ACZ90_06380 [Streptomyces albus subsp. albus]|nr:hypothetical protein ACZ90_06380 [Streptomyces albus subsp. albus]